MTENQQPLIIHMIDEFAIGGAQTHLVTMLREAKRSYNFRHHVVSLFGTSGVEFAFDEVGITHDTLDFRSEIRTRNYFKIIFELRKYLKALNADYLECHLTWSRLLGLHAGRLAGIERRFGFEQGDIYLNSAITKIGNFISQLDAEKIIVCSHALDHLYRKRNWISKAKTKVIHNCLDPEKFKHSVNIQKTDTGTIRFICVGTLGVGVNKRVDIAIKAFSDLCNSIDIACELVICGDGEQKDDLIKLSQKLGHADKIKFMGNVKDVGTEFANSDIFVHCSPFEPFGIVALEAMYHKLPCLLPNAGGMPEIFKDGQCGYFYEALNVNELSGLMHKMVVEPERRKSLGEKGKAIVEEKYLVEKYMKTLFQTYGLT